MNKPNKFLQKLMIIVLVLFFTGVFQKFVYNGKAKGCSGEYFQKYRDTMATDQVMQIINKECVSYRTTYKMWKYVALGSAVVFKGGGVLRGVSLK